eukprot:Gb_01333 [translate_table: standard]
MESVFFNMANNLCLCLKLFAMFAIVLVCPQTVHGLKRNRTERVTHLHFYMHDIVFGPNATSIPVAAPSGNSSSPGFGTVFVIDDALTAGPSLNSRLIGRAQGMYVADSLNDYSLMLLFTAVLQSGKHNGSTISIQGADRIDLAEREVSVVGGTGRFRFARGYAVIMTHSLDSSSVVLKFNVTVIH